MSENKSLKSKDKPSSGGGADSSVKKVQHQAQRRVEKKQIKHPHKNCQV